MTYGKAAFTTYQTLMTKHFNGHELLVWDELCEVEQRVWESVATNIVRVLDSNRQKTAKFIGRCK